MNNVFNCLCCGRYSSEFPLCIKCDKDFQRWMRYQRKYNLDKKGLKSPVNIWLDDLAKKKGEEKK